jgi:hypothetical protein
MVHNTQNYWVFELFPSSRIPSLEYQTMEKVQKPSNSDCSISFFVHSSCDFFFRTLKRILVAVYNSLRGNQKYGLNFVCKFVRE